MNRKPLITLVTADVDVDAAVDYYLREADKPTASRFIEALDAAKGLIVGNPRLGSPRYAEALDIPNLRHRKLKRFPYIVFYFERAEQIEIWHVLHTARDIPAWLKDDEE